MYIYIKSSWLNILLLLCQLGYGVVLLWWEHLQMHTNHTHHRCSITERSCQQLHGASRPRDLPNTLVTTEPILRRNSSERNHASPGTAQQHAPKPASISRSLFYFLFFPFLCLNLMSPIFLFSAFHPFFVFSSQPSLCLITFLQQNVWKSWIPATRHALCCDSQWDHSGSPTVQPAPCQIKNSLWSTNSAVLLSCAQIKTQKQKAPSI